MTIRMRRTGICPSCNEAPKENANGVVQCACGRRWYSNLSVEGTEEETANFKSIGLDLSEDRDGNKYYCDPWGHLIELYADGTWYSDKARPSESLQEYLDRIEQQSCLMAQI